jgi:membrane protease subunit HflK
MDRKIDANIPPESHGAKSLEAKSFWGRILGMAGPWQNGDGDDGGGDGPRNPWGQPASGSSGGRKGGTSSLEELFRKGTGGGFKGGIPKRPSGRPWWPILLIGFIILWALLTSIHRISPQERGVVTFLGSYSRTMQPGLHFSLPSPLEQVTKLDVEVTPAADWRSERTLVSFHFSAGKRSLSNTDLIVLPDMIKLIFSYAPYP